MHHQRRVSPAAPAAPQAPPQAQQGPRTPRFGYLVLVRPTSYVLRQTRCAAYPCPYGSTRGYFKIVTTDGTTYGYLSSAANQGRFTNIVAVSRTSYRLIVTSFARKCIGTPDTLATVYYRSSYP